MAEIDYSTITYSPALTLKEALCGGLGSYQDALAAAHGCVPGGAKPAAYFYPRERVEALFAGRECLSIEEIMTLDIPLEDRLFVVLRERMIPGATLWPLLADIAEELLPAWERWAHVHSPRHLVTPRWALATMRAWLAGEDPVPSGFVAMVGKIPHWNYVTGHRIRGGDIYSPEALTASAALAAVDGVVHAAWRARSYQRAVAEKAGEIARFLSATEAGERVDNALRAGQQVAAARACEAMVRAAEIVGEDALCSRILDAVSDIPAPLPPLHAAVERHAAACEAAIQEMKEMAGAARRAAKLGAAAYDAGDLSAAESYAAEAVAGAMYARDAADRALASARHVAQAPSYADDDISFAFAYQRLSAYVRFESGPRAATAQAMEDADRVLSYDSYGQGIFEAVCGIVRRVGVRDIASAVDAIPRGGFYPAHNDIFFARKNHLRLLREEVEAKYYDNDVWYTMGTPRVIDWVGR